MEAKAGDPTREGVPKRVVQATIKLLAEQGPSGIKARTVASASGLSTMAVYHHFGGIAELMRAAVDHGFKELDTAFSEVPVTEDPLADLFAMALTTRRVARENPHQACARLIASGRVRQQQPEVLAAQLWSFVHGFITLELAEHFVEVDDPVAQVLQPLGVNLAVGLGDKRERAQASHEAGVRLYDSIA